MVYKVLFCRGILNEIRRQRFFYYDIFRYVDQQPTGNISSMLHIQAIFIIFDRFHEVLFDEFWMFF